MAPSRIDAPQVEQNMDHYGITFSQLSQTAPGLNVVCWGRTKPYKRMLKRILFSIVGAGMGGTIGVLVTMVGGGSAAIIGCAIAGFVLTFSFLGVLKHS